jgi:ABC-type nitrate/sulfonate/bicarbonate transport system permease component
MNFDTTSVFAAIVMETLLVLGANALMSALERLLLRWRPPLDSLMES